MKNGKLFLLICVTGFLIAELTRQTLCAGSYIGSKDKEIFDRYADKLWSEEIKKIVKDQYVRLERGDIEEQKEAILVLYDIRAIELLEQVLGFGNEVEASLAAALLTKLARRGDIDQATRLLPLIPRRHYAMNYEARQAVRGQRANVIELVTKITGQDFDDIKYESENGMDLVAERVGKWIKSQQPASQKR